MTVVFDAEQLAVDPPLLPLQDQYHDPEPLTEEAVPALQRPLVGVLLNDWPFDEPQLPLVLVDDVSSSNSSGTITLETTVASLTDQALRENAAQRKISKANRLLSGMMVFDILYNTLNSS
ncbi:hypothetical protein CCP4SC76_1220008 [Gammaproteobacteria bacterium]